MSKRELAVRVLFVVIDWILFALWILMVRIRVLAEFLERTEARLMAATFEPPDWEADYDPYNDAAG